MLPESLSGGPGETGAASKRLTVGPILLAVPPCGPGSLLARPRPPGAPARDPLPGVVQDYRRLRSHRAARRRSGRSFPSAIAGGDLAHARTRRRDRRGGPVPSRGGCAGGGGALPLNRSARNRGYLSARSKQCGVPCSSRAPDGERSAASSECTSVCASTFQCCCQATPRVGAQVS
jgi:hypothetical protein